MSNSKYYITWDGKPNTQRLLPVSYARPMPDYIPTAVVNDYREACAIVDLSPKAAATLARRALQGIIRDFHGIIEPTLNKEILKLKDVVDPLVWQAIDAVRTVGNIGAHMEHDINVIVDVDPDEVVKLIRLIEMLVNEWYVARFNRSQALQEMVVLAAKKTEQRNPSSNEEGTTAATNP